MAGDSEDTMALVDENGKEHVLKKFDKTTSEDGKTHKVQGMKGVQGKNTGNR